jgi:hypothetical protein
MRSLSMLMIALVLSASCGGAAVGYSAGVSVTTPDLVAVGPGVSVIADYEEPIFYSDGFYWRNYDGYWYRSRSYVDGWAYVYAPPYAISRIDRPYIYRHYRPRGYVSRYRPVPAREIRPPRRVIHRDYRDIQRDPGYQRDRIYRDRPRPIIHRD